MRSGKGARRDHDWNGRQRRAPGRPGGACKKRGVFAARADAATVILPVVLNVIHSFGYHRPEAWLPPPLRCPWASVLALSRHELVDDLLCPFALPRPIVGGTAQLVSSRGELPAQRSSGRALRGTEGHWRGLTARAGVLDDARYAEAQEQQTSAPLFAA